MFILVLDDFGVQFMSKHNAEHLHDFLTNLYIFKTDWTGSNFLGLTLERYYINCNVEFSMPDYVNDALHKFHHPGPETTQDELHRWNKSSYGKTTQYTNPEDNSPILYPQEINLVQKIVGTFI